MELSTFLVHAKKKSYANKKAIATLLEDGSKEFKYAEGDYKYRDQYVGYNPFSGVELVWEKNKVIWTMSYYGKVFGFSDILPSEVYAFLRKALKQVSVESPFRGLPLFWKDELEYHNETKGTLDYFVGIEKIVSHAQTIYQLQYQGGMIRDK